MKSIKKKVTLALAGLMVTAAVATPVVAKTVFEKNESGWAYKYDDEVGVKVNWLIGTEKTSAHVTEAGQQASYYVTAEGAEKVEYQLWYYNTKGEWVSTEWSEAVDAKVPHLISLPEGEVLKDGMNEVSVWVREAGKEDAHFENQYGSYDAYNFTGVKATDVDFNFGGDVNAKVVGDTLTFNGFEGLEDVSYKLNVYNNETGKWTSSEYGVNEIEIPEGEVLVNVHIDTNNDGKWDGYRLFMVEEQEATEVTVFDTVVEAGGGVGKVLSVNMTEAGKAEFPTATQFQVVQDGDAVTTKASLDSKTTIYLPGVAEYEGQEVVVNLLNAEGEVVKAINVKLGESGVIVKEPTAPEVDYKLKATVRPGGGVGQILKVEALETYENVAKYQAYYNGEKVTTVVGIGEETTIYLKGEAEYVGKEVTVKLFDANDAEIGSANVTLAK